MRFTFSSGSRPLEGYTIKRGIGQGGFGEVYYAVSDGGKEVALKLVRDHHGIELRGMAQCLNLKHPNLVSLYDIKRDADGESWVVMELVSGENLGRVLQRHPSGLPPDLASQWFLALADAVGYLHTNGIVHRDLKPGNIFIENGMVKVGDYGLSKFISTSRRSGQTQSVGTVHYMAPEISKGTYGKEVDIYAAGIILYEMLTGKVPFDGESAGEILLKHLTDSPDLSKLPPQYRPIVGKALAKRPGDRYQSFAEMAQAVRALEQPDGSGQPASKTKTKQVVSDPKTTPVVEPVSLDWRTQAAELAGSMVLSAVAASLCAMVWAAIDHGNGLFASSLLPEFGSTLLLLVLGTWVVLVPGKIWDHRRGDDWLRRGTMVVLGLGLGVVAAWLNGWSFDINPTGQVSLVSATMARMKAEDAISGRLFGYMAFFGIALGLMRWWKLTARSRPSRFNLFPVLLAGCIGLVLSGMWPEERRTLLIWQGPVVLALVAAIVQLVSPWAMPARKPTRRLRLRYS